MTDAVRGWKSDEARGPIGAWFTRAIGDRSIEQVAKDTAWGSFHVEGNASASHGDFDFAFRTYVRERAA